MERWGKIGRFLWGLLVISLLLSGKTVWAQPGAISLDEYWQTIAQIRDELNSAAEEETAVRETAVSTLSNITQIELADGRMQPIDHSYFIRQLENEAVSNEALATLFTVYHGSRLGWPEPSLSQVDEAALDDILSQPEFDYTPEEPNFFQRLWQDIRQRIEDFFLNLFPEGSGSNLPISDLLVILAAVLVIGVLAYAMRGLITDFTADAAMSAEEELGGEPLSAETALQKAQTLSSEGDYRTAVRYLYLSALLLLEERGLLRYDRSLTNREYLRSVANRPELAATLREVIDVFDRVWYGFQTLSASEYDTYARRVETLRQQKETR